MRHSRIIQAGSLVATFIAVATLVAVARQQSQGDRTQSLQPIDASERMFLQDNPDAMEQAAPYSRTQSLVQATQQLFPMKTTLATPSTPAAPAGGGAGGNGVVVVYPPHPYGYGGFYGGLPMGMPMGMPMAQPMPMGMPMAQPMGMPMPMAHPIPVGPQPMPVGPHPMPAVPTPSHVVAVVHTPPAGTIVGAIVNAVTGQPLAAAQIQIRPSIPLGVALDTKLTMTTSSATGEFMLPKIPVALYEITVNAPGFISVSQRVRSWPASAVGCTMLPMSPLLKEAQVRVVATWGPHSPTLAGCIKFGENKRCSVGMGAERQCKAQAVSGVEDIQAPALSTCGMGMSTITLTNEVLDNVDYKVTVPGRSAVCGNENAGARSEKGTVDAFPNSNAKVQVYISNSMGQEFVVDTGSEIDFEGWKIFQYNGTTTDLGPYVTPTPSYNGEITGIIVNAVDAKPIKGAHARLVATGTSPHGYSDFQLTGSVSDSGEFSFLSVPVGEWEMQVEAKGFISEAQLVRSWALHEQGCIMFVMSPLLKNREVRLVLTYGPHVDLTGCTKFLNCSVGAASKASAQKQDSQRLESCSVFDSAIPETISAKVDVHNPHVGVCKMGLSTITMKNEDLDNVDYKVTVPGLTPACGDADAWSYLHHPVKVRKAIEPTMAHVKVYVDNVHGQAFEVGSESVIDGEGWKVFQFNGTTDNFGPYVTAAPTFGGELRGVVIDAKTGKPIPDAILELHPDPGNPRWFKGWTNSPGSKRRLLTFHAERLMTEKDGTFDFGHVPHGDALIAVDAPGYISIEEGVKAWAWNEDGCIMIPLSPLLKEGEIRMVLTYAPKAPKLDGCLLFEDCVVGTKNPHCHANKLQNGTNVTTAGLVDIHKHHVSVCRMGLETFSMENEVLDFVNFKLTVPGKNTICGMEALPADDEVGAKKDLLASRAQLSVYVRNNRGQQFEVGPSSVIDKMGWKIFQYNESTIHLGPYATITPTVEPTKPPTPVPTLPPTTMSPTAYGGEADGYVYDATDGKTLSGVKITVVGPGGPQAVETDKEGHFHFKNVPLPTLQFTAAKKGYITVTRVKPTYEAGGSGCIFLVLSPVLLKDQVRAVLTWTNITKGMTGYTNVVDCDATAKSPTCTHSGTVNGVTATSTSVHDVEFQSLGKCKFGLSTNTVTGEKNDVIKYIASVNGDLQADLVAAQGGKPNLTPQDMAAVKADYHATGAILVFYTSNDWSKDVEIPVGKTSWIDYEGWHVLNYDSQSGVLVDWANGGAPP